MNWSGIFLHISKITRTFAPDFENQLIFDVLKKTTATMNAKQILKIVVSVLIAALTALGAAIGLNSCNVVRTITNKSEFYQRGDTSVMIQTKTTESYDASKKL